MWIKLCANTSLDDALLCVDAGADAIGFVFAPSIRRVTPGQVATFIPELPSDITKIGIFLTQDLDEILFTLRSTALDGAQLHGQLDFSLIESLRAAFPPSFFLIQTLHWDLSADPARAANRLRDELRSIARHAGIDAILLDSKTANASGGTGKTLDWPRAHDVLSEEAGKLRVILAGGLTPDNVAEAIHTLRPWGVDVASGVETRPGRKDPGRAQAFVFMARTAFAEIENFTPPAE